MTGNVQKRSLLLALIGIMVVWAASWGINAVPAVAQDAEQAEITAPTAGQSLFGLVTITGSARAAGFSSYRLEYDDLRDPQTQWFLVQEIVTQQVSDDVLGTWNTNMVPDGTYRLRLRVDRSAGEPLEYVVSNLRVLNSEPTPLPTIAAAPDLPTGAPPTPGPTPTSLIEQPPGSSTDLGGPSDSETIVDEASRMADPDEQDNTPTRINLDRVEESLCTGALVTLALFVVALGYIGLRNMRRQSNM